MAESRSRRFTMLCSLQDRAEIDDLLARYCMALDTRNWAEFPHILTEDVTWDYSDEFGTAHHGIEEVVNAIRSAIEPHPACMHAPLMTRGLVHGTRYRGGLFPRALQFGSGRHATPPAGPDYLPG